MALTHQTEEFTIGVEEEYQIIDPQTRQLCGRSQVILPMAQALSGTGIVQLEFRQSQLEVATPICHSLQEVRTHLTQLRQQVIEVAEQAGCQIAAGGTHPFSRWQEQALTPKACYVDLAHHYQHLMHELVTFGCHVHIGLSDRNMVIQVMNRARLWLAPLLALSASSPFWMGQDTGYASYRAVLIGRLPMTGAPPLLNSYADYRAMVRTLLTTQTIYTPAQVCWDLRPSERFPTLEFRVADMATTVDEAVMLTGLVRGLVRTCYEQACLQKPFKAACSELLRAASWRAARWGLDAELVDLETERIVPARTLIERLLNFIRPALDAWNEWDEVSFLTRQVMQRGTSAARQRDVYQNTHSFKSVIDAMVQETLPQASSVDCNKPWLNTSAIANVL